MTRPVSNIMNATGEDKTNKEKKKNKNDKNEIFVDIFEKLSVSIELNI